MAAQPPDNKDMKAPPPPQQAAPANPPQQPNNPPAGLNGVPPAKFAKPAKPAKGAKVAPAKGAKPAPPAPGFFQAAPVMFPPIAPAVQPVQNPNPPQPQEDDKPQIRR